jgi:hypothetical protein
LRAAARCGGTRSTTAEAARSSSYRRCSRSRAVTAIAVFDGGDAIEAPHDDSTFAA